MSAILEIAQEVLRAKSLQDNIDTITSAISHFSSSIKRLKQLLANRNNDSKIKAEDWATLVKLEHCITEELEVQTTHLLDGFEESCVRSHNGDEFDERSRLQRIDDQKKARNQLKEQVTRLTDLRRAKADICDEAEKMLDAGIVEGIEKEEGRVNTYTNGVDTREETMF
ncbi:hypothetical protein E6O75_ATG09446 [Venturia nashicola]|uniref:Uncharacterized protein n=1 Tax=Venturia nashicola TaxID=86259 RepID=A0A4Z1NG07_9PEZI|nr:hypothetical protein E6O75_ATG09446 [Venturia nashicola]